MCVSGTLSSVSTVLFAFDTHTRQGEGGREGERDTGTERGREGERHRDRQGREGERDTGTDKEREGGRGRETESCTHSLQV